MLNEADAFFYIVVVFIAIAAFAVAHYFVDRFYQDRPPWRLHDVPSMKRKIVICTGANAGVGFEFCRHMAKRDAHVVLACRNLEKGRSAVAAILAEIPSASVEVRQVDMADRDSIDAFSKAILASFSQVDVLCHNAGAILDRPRLIHGWDETFVVNAVAPFALTVKLWPLLSRTPNARVVFVSSNMHSNAAPVASIAELNDPKRFMISRYAIAKAALLCAVKELSQRAAQARLSLKIVAANPGAAGTHFMDSYGGLIGLLVRAWSMSPEQAAACYLYAATAPEVQSGQYYGPAGIGSHKGWPSTNPVRGPARDAAFSLRMFDWLQRAADSPSPV